MLAVHRNTMHAFGQPVSPTDAPREYVRIVGAQHKLMQSVAHTGVGEAR